MALKGREKVLAKYKENADKLVRGLALETTKRVVQKTPVDTARAANNWNVATGAPDATNLEEGDYAKDGSMAVAKAAGAVEGIEAGDTIYVTNALPYIPELERGHSKQAPSGMIALTVAEMQPVADQVVRKIRGGGG